MRRPSTVPVTPYTHQIYRPRSAQKIAGLVASFLLRPLRVYDTQNNTADERHRNACLSLFVCSVIATRLHSRSYNPGWHAADGACSEPRMSR